MRLAIGQFYLDASYGVMKFLGYSEREMLLFNQYERELGTNRWCPKGTRVNIDKSFFQKRAKIGRTKQIPPPQ